MKGSHLSCTIFPFHLSDFERFPWGFFNHLLMTTILGHFPLGGTNLGGYLYYNHPARHVFMRTHSLMIYTPIGHDCFKGAGRGQREREFMSFSGNHGIWETYRLHSLDGSLILLFLSFSFSPSLSFHFSFPSSVSVLSLFDGCRNDDLWAGFY